MSSPLRIVLAADRIASFGGIETHMATLGQSLSDHGHIVALLFSQIDNERLFDTVVESGATVHSICSSDWHGFVRDFHADVFHAHSYGASVKGIPIARELGIPAVITLHGPSQQVYTDLVPSHSQPVDSSPGGSPPVGYICVSEEIKRKLEETGKQLYGPVVVIENGIDLNRFQPRVKRLGPPWNVLYLGRVGPSKQDGVRALEEALAHLPGIRPSYVSTWRSKGKPKPLVDCVPALQRSHVVFSTGRGIREAMACGCVAFVLGSYWDDVVTPRSVHALSKFNFSGRSSMTPPTPDIIRASLLRLLSDKTQFRRLAAFGIKAAKSHWDATLMMRTSVRFYRLLLARARHVT